MKPNHILAFITVALIFFLIIVFFIVKSQEDTTIKAPTSAPTPTVTTDLDFRGQVSNNQKNPTTAQNMDVPELKIEDVKEGTGAAVKTGDTLVVNYEGSLLNGTKFDSSFDRNEPFEVKIGVGSVIAGWDQGIIGMKVGGRRTLTIPSSLAYGSQGAGGGIIPPNAGLVFKIELIEIKSLPGEPVGM